MCLSQHKVIYPNQTGLIPTRHFKKVVESNSHSLKNEPGNSSPSFSCMQLASLLVGVSTFFVKLNKQILEFWIRNDSVVRLGTYPNQNALPGRRCGTHPTKFGTYPNRFGSYSNQNAPPGRRFGTHPSKFGTYPNRFDAYPNWSAIPARLLGAISTGGPSRSD